MKGQTDGEIAIEEKNQSIIQLPIILCLYTVLHIAMLVTGILYADECPVESAIPLYLSLQGILGLLSRSIGSVRYFIRNQQCYFLIVAVSSLLYLVEFILFLLGSYWVYKEYPPSFNVEDAERYCQKGTYLFAFCYITIMYCLMILALAFLCCACCAAVMFGASPVTQGKYWQILVI